jgi:peptidoglycan/xylan/chitin deacetylase (PgdA/CDA1 family)
MSSRVNLRSTPALQVSAWLHVAALGGALLYPAAWPVAVGAVVADHLALMTAGLLPRSRLLGPNRTRLSAASRARRELAVTLDDGPDPDVTPQVLRILAEFGARASFFVIGARLDAHPGLGREILRQGHTLENHSYTHRHDFSLLGPARLRNEIARTQQSIAAVGGESRFFRAPAGLRNPFLEGQLRRQGLQLVSWTRRGFDTVSKDPAQVHARLARRLAAGDILLLHDGHAARSATGRPLVLDVLPRLLDTLRSHTLTPVHLRAGLA